jgi:hypothetical protein
MYIPIRGFSNIKQTGVLAAIELLCQFPGISLKFQYHLYLTILIFKLYNLLKSKNFSFDFFCLLNFKRIIINKKKNNNNYDKFLEIFT